MCSFCFIAFMRTRVVGPIHVVHKHEERWQSNCWANVQNLSEQYSTLHVKFAV